MKILKSNELIKLSYVLLFRLSLFLGSKLLTEEKILQKLPLHRRKK